MNTVYETEDGIFNQVPRVYNVFTETPLSCSSITSKGSMPKDVLRSLNAPI